MHAQPMSSADEDWVWLCTGKGYVYVNFNADSDEEAPVAPHNLNGASCCLYDTAPETTVIPFTQFEVSSEIIKLPFQAYHSSEVFSYYSPRAPPFYFSYS